MLLSECFWQDEDWDEEEKLNQGFKEDEFAYLSELIGPKGIPFDSDDVLQDSDDEDMKNDPVSQMDMNVCISSFVSYLLWTNILLFQAHLLSFFRECAAKNLGNFNAIVEQMTAEELAVVQMVIGR